MAKLLKADQKCEIMGIGKGKRTSAGPGTTMERKPLNRSEQLMGIGSVIDEFAWRASEDALSTLPNDLTRLVYLASIRDYNSGTYRHSLLSKQFNSLTMHRAFDLWHQEVFARLLTNSICNYVAQLEGYLRYSRAERRQFIATWKSLQAYKAAIPLRVPRRACETFFLNVQTALTILEISNEQLN
jgi:hypothetical protein